MATTISLPTSVTTNSITGSNLFAADGTNTTGVWDDTHADVELSGFSSLSIPSGATINGIEVIVNGQGNPAANTPKIVVHNGTSYSSSYNFLGSFSKGNSTFDPGWGGSGNLFGLSWTPTTAAGIKVLIPSSTIQPSGRRLYWDYVKVRITYTAASGYGHDVNGVAAANIGKVNGIATASIEKVNGI